MWFSQKGTWKHGNYYYIALASLQNYYGSQIQHEIIICFFSTVELQLS